jgi:predicted Zn-dependent protease
VQPIDSPDAHHLAAAIGWLELGRADEALKELDRIDPALQRHADVLEARWMILASQKSWDAAAQVGRTLIAADPERPSAWLHHAYALRRASDGGLIAAFNALSPVADKFPGESTIPYNLACYTCQLNRDATETLDWLKRAVATGDRKDIFAMALSDPDLAPLHDVIAKLARDQRGGA